MFSPDKLRTLELLHGREMALQLQEASAKDASELDKLNVMRKDDTPATPPPATPVPATPPPATPVVAEEVVKTVPEEFEAQVISGFELMTTQMTAIAANLEKVNTRLDDVEKNVKTTQEQQGGSRATLGAWLLSKTVSATETPDAEMLATDPFAVIKPVETVAATNGHLLGGL